jgi:hypothetical protein
MLVDLNGFDIDALLEALELAKQKVRDADGTPYPVRQENLARLDDVAGKLRAARSQAG